MLRQKALFQDNSNLATSFWTTISVVTTYWKKENNGYQAAMMKTKKSMNLSEDNTTKQTVVRRCIYRKKDGKPSNKFMIFDQVPAH